MNHLAAHESAAPSFAAGQNTSWLQFLARKRIAVTWLLSSTLAIRAIIFKNVVSDPFQLTNPISLTGLALIGTGLAIRSWAASVIHKEQTLSTMGPYSACRHPLYLGTLLMLVGFGFAIHDLWTGLVLFLAFWVLYWPTMKREEGRLLEIYGPTWTAYRERTGMLCPTRLPRGLGPISRRRWRANREYRAILGAALGLIGAKLWSVLAFYF